MSIFTDFFGLPPGIDERLTALSDDNQQIKGMLIMLEQDIKAAVDQIALNTSVEQSAAQALGLLATQVADLSAKLATVQPGEVVTPETKAALAASVGNLQTSLTSLSAAIPANVPPTPAP